jgi:hypothetical protein
MLANSHRWLTLFRVPDPQLYALFKQGSQDPPFNPDDKPGTFDFKVRPTKSYQQSRPSASQLYVLDYHPESAPAMYSSAWTVWLTIAQGF